MHSFTTSKTGLMKRVSAPNSGKTLQAEWVVNNFEYKIHNVLWNNEGQYILCYRIMKVGTS